MLLWTRSLINRKHLATSWFLAWLIALLSWSGAAQSEIDRWAAETQCKSCHEQAYSHWQQSHHAFAMSAATIDTIDDLPVAYTLGYEPLQQFLIPMADGRLQAYNKAWDTVRQQWFDLYPDLAKSPEHPLHWGQIAHQANTQCISCHVSDYRTNFDAEQQRFNSSWQALGVGCQSCHGPANEHLQWAQQNSQQQQHTDNYGFTLQLFEADQQLQVCAQCHSRRNELQPLS